MSQEQESSEQEEHEPSSWSLALEHEALGQAALQAQHSNDTRTSLEDLGAATCPSEVLQKSS